MNSTESHHNFLYKIVKVHILHKSLPQKWNVTVYQSLIKMINMNYDYFHMNILVDFLLKPLVISKSFRGKETIDFVFPI